VVFSPGVFNLRFVHLSKLLRDVFELRVASLRLQNTKQNQAIMSRVMNDAVVSAFRWAEEVLRVTWTVRLSVFSIL
jgi:hypothetical protein